MTQIPTERDALRAVPSVVILWLFTRTVTLLLMQAAGGSARGDVGYYHDSLTEVLPVDGIGGTMVEYPLPAVGILRLPTVFGDDDVLYATLIFVLLAALDAVFTAIMFRHDGGRRGAATNFWLLMVPLMGPVVFNRFDLVPALLVGGAVLAAARRPAVAGALVAAGAAVKLWPAVLFPVFLARRAGRWAVTAGFAVTGLVLAVGSWAAAGWDFDRLTSPLTWQSERGLQIESVWATPHMLVRAFGDTDVRARPSEYGAWEVFGGGVSAMLTATDVVLVLGFVVIAALSVRALRAGGVRPEALAALTIAITAIVMFTGKTLSPQYLLWLGGPMAAAIALSAVVTPAVRRLAWMLLAMAALSQVIFPILYDGLLDREGHALLVVSTLLLLVRNVALTVFTALAVRHAWRETAPVS